MPDWAVWLIIGVSGFVVLKSLGGWTASLGYLAGSVSSSLSAIRTGGQSDPAVLTLEQAEMIASQLGVTDPDQLFNLLLLTEPDSRRQRITAFLSKGKP